jgi:hypothetical protein
MTVRYRQTKVMNKSPKVLPMLDLSLYHKLFTHVCTHLHTSIQRVAVV